MGEQGAADRWTAFRGGAPSGAPFLLRKGLEIMYSRLSMRISARIAAFAFNCVPDVLYINRVGDTPSIRALRFSGAFNSFRLKLSMQIANEPLEHAVASYR